MRPSQIAPIFGALIACASGAGNSPPPPPPCDPACTDQVAARALRDAMKLAYNLTLQGKPVGPQDQSTPCPFGGTAHVFGTATANATQGTTSVDLTYAFQACAYERVDTDPTKNYQVTVDGSVTEVGTLAVQPSSTTALRIESSAVSVSGTVYAPAVGYTATSCAVLFAQDGNQLSGTLCGRQVGVAL